MPDDTAPFPGALSFQQSFDGQFDRPKLLIAPDNFNGLSLVVGRKEGECLDQVQQIVLIEHPGYQALLVIWSAGAMLQVINCAWIGVSPAVEVFFAMSSDSPELGFLAAGGDDKLVIEKKWGAAFTLDATLFAVTEHLVNGLGDGILDFR